MNAVLKPHDSNPLTLALKAAHDALALREAESEGSESSLEQARREHERRQVIAERAAVAEANASVEDAPLLAQRHRDAVASESAALRLLRAAEDSHKAKLAATNAALTRVIQAADAILEGEAEDLAGKVLGHLDNAERLGEQLAAHVPNAIFERIATNFKATPIVARALERLTKLRDDLHRPINNFQAANPSRARVLARRADLIDGDDKV